MKKKQSVHIGNIQSMYKNFNINVHQVSIPCSICSASVIMTGIISMCFCQHKMYADDTVPDVFSKNQQQAANKLTEAIAHVSY